MKLADIEHKHFQSLFEITSICEPWWGLDRNTCDRLFSQREGFVLLNNNQEVVGHVTFSDYGPKMDVMIHCSVLPEYHTKWLTKSIYKQVFDRVFIDLECVRASGWAAVGLNDLTFHERLGFKIEGIHRKSLRIHNKYYDVLKFGMLAEERRW